MKRTTILTPCTFAMLALLVLTAGSAIAQRGPQPTGLFLNAHLNATGIGYDEDDFQIFGVGDNTHTGGGAGVMIGYGFSPLFTLYLGANGSLMENDFNQQYTLAHADLGVQLNFVSRSQLVPYLTGALTFRQATIDFPPEVDFNGGGLTGGGGLKYFVSPQLALDVGLTGTLGNFTEVDFGAAAFDINDIGAASVRLMLGLSWYPAPRRR